MKKPSLLTVGLLLFCMGWASSVFAQLPNPNIGSELLDPLTIPKYADPLVIPPTMPAVKLIDCGGKQGDYYEIAMKQFAQQILPVPFKKTTVWSYGAEGMPGTFNYPAFTIEAKVDRPVRVKWINGLVDLNGNYLPHLFAIDQTLHWANPVGPRDFHGMDPNPYTGPVPMVTHVHGAHVDEESDGYPEAWWLPAAKDIPPYIQFTTGTYYDQYKAIAEAKYGQTWDPGSAVYQYRNDQRAATLWYHDHSLGMTRLNVYAGPAGFYNLRGGSSDLPDGILPGPAPMRGDPAGMKYYEIPIAIQDRIFTNDGQLFFPDNRAFFEGLLPSQLQIPFHPAINPLNGLVSDVAPIWNPEFFGNTMVVNGKTWPYLNVEPRRYRFRLLNGCNARFLILAMDNPAVSFWQIGSEGGFLPAPVNLSQLLIGPAERADVIVDFTGLAPGTEVVLQNLGPDTPFGGGVPGVDFPPADSATTGQVMKFMVVAAGPGSLPDTSTPPASLVLPAFTPLGMPTATRQLSLNEMNSATVNVSLDINGNVVLDAAGLPFGPTWALLGTLNPDGTGNPLLWMDTVTENPQLNDTEIWEIHNFTMDAHPIHLHMVMFQVVDRTPMGQVIGGPSTRPPEPWEAGYKDTVMALPGEITRIKAKFDIAGRYAWHCHIIDHEDNEMMRPYEVVAAPAPAEVIVDNRDPSTSSVGTWEISGAAGFWAIDSVWSRTYGGRFRFSANLMPGTYEVYEWHTEWPSRVTNAPHRIRNGTTLLGTVNVNQRINGSQWNLLGTYTFNNVASVTIYATPGNTNSTNADAVRFVSVP